MGDLGIALLQFPAVPDAPRLNLDGGLRACRTARDLGADIAVFPEMWQVGYTPCPDNDPGRRLWLERAIDIDDPWIAAFQRLARRSSIAVVVTFLQRWPRGPRNAAAVIDRDGRVILTYAKVHTCDFAFEAALTPGTDFPVATLHTRHGPVRVGVMICYDREFPEAARELMLGGAEVLLTPNACELTDDRIGQFRARAFENMVAVAMANYADARCHGRSCAFDGAAFAADGSPRDHRLVQAGEEPGVVLARVDLDLLRRYRAAEARGDAYRKPHVYPPGGARRPGTAVRPPGRPPLHRRYASVLTPSGPRSRALSTLTNPTLTNPRRAQVAARSRRSFADKLSGSLIGDTEDSADIAHRQPFSGKSMRDITRELRRSR